MKETRALRMSGFDIQTAEAKQPTLVWLVASPQPQARFDEIDLTDAGIANGIWTMQLLGEKEQRVGKRLATAIEQSLSLVEWAALYTSDKRDHLDVQKQKLRPIVSDALNFVRLHDPRRRV